MKHFIFLYVSMLVAILGGLNNQLFADEIDEDLKFLSLVQTWEGKNGKSIRGRFIKRDGDTIHIITDRGKNI